jgi:soluble lytic murein transglycosylase
MFKPLEIKFFRGFLFLLFMFVLTANSCAKAQIEHDFYRSLKNKSNPARTSHAVADFERALSDSNMYVRQTAAEELANFMYQGRKLSAKTIEQVRSEVTGTWAAAFDAVSSIPDKEKALVFLLNFEQGAAVPNEARLYTLREFERAEIVFSETETAAIDGHYAVSLQQYGEALDIFRKFMIEAEGVAPQWPDTIPPLFVKYPGLINDLGRAFQYTSSGKEGSDLFLLWEKNLDGSIANNDLRYSLYFYAGRVMRRRGVNEDAFAIFEKARSYAAKGEPSDACIWYLLDLSLSRPDDIFLQRLENLVKNWNDPLYFDDILEKFLQNLASKRDWKRMVRAFNIIKDSGAVSTAAYAWLIARLIQEGLVSGEEVQNANPADFIRIAYNVSGIRSDSFTQYYRALSAKALGEPFMEFQLVYTPPQTTKRNYRGPKEKESQAFQFIMGFFNNDAIDSSFRYTRALEKELTPSELRSISRALAKEGYYAQSIRQVSRYINREGYKPLREDMELLFPRHYSELVEKYAAEHNTTAALLYGLIRTESAFQSSVVSRAGAVGLTQLMPATARDAATRIRREGGPDFFDSERNLNLTDPSMNVYIGAYFFNSLMGRFEDTLLALMAYNGGPNRVRRWRAGNTMPTDIFMETVSISETRDYGRKVLGAAAVYELLYFR